MDPYLQEMINNIEEGFQEVEAIIRLQKEGTYPDGIRVVTEFKDIITCRLLRKDIITVYNSEEVASMKAAKFIGARWDWDSDITTPKNYTSDAHTGLPTGKGIVYGIIDWGADFAHPNFIDKEKGSRFICIWDQSHKEGILPYGYGKLYTRDMINEAIKGPYPYESLGYHPGRSDSLGLGSHCTHVMDIAVGNGRLGKKGFAPEADIIFVHLSSRGASRLHNLGDSVRILEALDFIDRMAGNKKLVINMSLGRMGGSKEGISPVEQGMDNFLEMKKNRMIVQSGGNYYNSKTHHSGILRPGGNGIFSFYSQKEDTTTDELEIWYSGKDEFEIELHHPRLQKKYHCSINDHIDLKHKGKIIGRIYSRTEEPNTNKNNINIFLYKNAPSGSWTAKLIGKKILDGRYHVWIERDSGCRQCQSKFYPQYVDRNYTTGTICNGYNSLVVGALDTTTPHWKLADFSSKGPTMDGRFKPDLVAPGVKIVAAKSTPKNHRKPVPGLTRMSGSSMATPHVSGGVAAILELIPIDLEAYEIKSLVLQSTSKVTVNEDDKMRIGAGIFNHEKLIQKSRKFVGKKLSKLLTGRYTQHGKNQ